MALSCVRSNISGDIGHVSNPKRANVALSRAKAELHIFANIGVIGRKHPWRQYLDEIAFVEDSQRYLGMSYDDGMAYMYDYDDAERRALGQFPALPQKPLQRQAIALSPRAA